MCAATGRELLLESQWSEIGQDMQNALTLQAKLFNIYNRECIERDINSGKVVPPWKRKSS
jgi:hypothetical protein